MPPKSVPRKPSAAISTSTAFSSSSLSSSHSGLATSSLTAIHPSKLATSSSSALSSLLRAYDDATPARLKLIDAFMLFAMLSGMSCFAYCVLITDFPMNAFLGAFASCVGQFVLLASLRSQVNPANAIDFGAVSPERAFADFAFASIILHFFSFNFLG